MTLPAAAFIPAAGFGTRMRPLTLTQPKPLIALGGVPLLDRAIGLVRDAGVGRIAVNAHHLADRIVAHLAGTGVAVSVEHPDILDTGGGLKAAFPLLGPADPVLTLNPDVLYLGPNPVRALSDAWRDGSIDALLLVVPLDRAAGRSRGDFDVAPDGRIRRGGDAVYAGAQLIRPGVLADWPDRVFGLNAVWDALIARDRIRAVVYPGHWHDVGTPQALSDAEAALAAARP
ncbi:MAG: nucleotidyltransferase family protein [Rhodobacteraceae bacterium]|jgi:MurNAc alpha-1-phosphate uridylyltransferase|nr:nucleotidyltransferase family protein [Paracoccaceae bacterium]